MTRTTIVLDPGLKKRVLKRAEKLQISMGELIRVSLERFLGEPSGVISNADSFFSDNVAYKEPGTNSIDDISINHDKYLYDE